MQRAMLNQMSTEKVLMFFASKRWYFLLTKNQSRLDIVFETSSVTACLRLPEDKRRHGVCQ
jgi:hypothetical protein